MLLRSSYVLVPPVPLHGMFDAPLIHHAGCGARGGRGGQARTGYGLIHTLTADTAEVFFPSRKVPEVPKTNGQYSFSTTRESDCVPGFGSVDMVPSEINF